MPMLRQSVRLGVSRAGVFKPVASLGLAKDGGIFVAPHAIGSGGWRYGMVREGGPEGDEQVATGLRPKLHYHSSGITRVTLSGNREDLELRQAHFPPIATLDRSQIFSIVSSRLWEFESAAGDRRGDAFSVEPRWPWGLAFTFSVVRIAPEHQLNLVLKDLAPMGLFSLDAQRFLIDLEGYGERLLLLGSVDPSHEVTSAREAGTSVIAMGQTQNSPSPQYFGLWSESVRSPMVKLEDSHEILSSAQLAQLENSRVQLWTHDELRAHLFG